MGIPKYRRWLEERFPSAFTSCSSVTADHVYVDLNSLMHEVGRLAASPEDFLQRLHGKLDGLFAVVRPVQTLFIAVDGPAAWAKVTEQRKRRRHTVRSDGKSSSRGGGRNARGRGRHRARQSHGPNAFSRNLLTPGLPFMDELTAALEHWCSDWMRSGGCLAECSASVVSGSSVVGEGEHKMLRPVPPVDTQAQMLANGAQTTADLANVRADPCEHVFVSGDADLFLLSLVQGLSRRVKVVADVRPGNRYGREACLTVWSTEALSDTICGELLRPDGSRAIAPRARGLGGAMPLSAEEQGLRRDFCLISLFSGDDYLPALACGISPKFIYEIYLAQRQKPEFQSETLVRSVPTERPVSHLPGGWAFNAGDLGEAFEGEAAARFEYHIPSLVALMGTIEDQERQQSRKQRDARDARDGSGNSNGTRAVTEHTEVGDEPGAVHGYLTGLLWVLELYHHGHCLDHGYIFRKKRWMHGARPQLIRRHAPVLAAVQSRSTSQPGAAGNLAAPERAASYSIALLPADFACQQLVRVAGMQPLASLFEESHPVLGRLVKLERCVECQRLKSILTEANRRVQTARIEMTQAAEANASSDIAKSQEEFDTLKVESLAANASLADHVDAEHPRAEVEWLEPTALDTAVKCVWSHQAGAAVPARGGDSCVPPRTLAFARAVKIVNHQVGMHHQREGAEQSDSSRKRPRYDANASAYARAGNTAAENAGLPERHVAPMNPERMALLQQQQQIEAAILRLTPAQVAGLSDEHSAMYWRLKRERHGGK